MSPDVIAPVAVRETRRLPNEKIQQETANKKKKTKIRLRINANLQHTLLPE